MALDENRGNVRQPDATGLARSRTSKNQPCGNPLGSWVGANKISKRKMLAARLVLFELHAALINKPIEPRPTATTVPTQKPSASARPRIPTPRASTHTYGMLTRNVANHSDNAATSLPPMIDRRETGVTSNVSSVPRSRSPLIPSALTTRVARTRRQLQTAGRG